MRPAGAGVTAQKSFGPGQRADRLLNSGNETVVVLARLRVEGIAELDARRVSPRDAAESGEHFIEPVDVRRHDGDAGVDRQDGSALLESADVPSAGERPL